jgi:hypothetical protein
MFLFSAKKFDSDNRPIFLIALTVYHVSSKTSLSAATNASSSHSIPPIEGEIRQNFFHFKNKNLPSDFL